MINKFKLVIISSILGLSLYSCQKDDLTQDVQSSKSSFFIEVGDNIKEGDLDIKSWAEQSTLKSSSTLNFIDGGIVMVNGQMMTTVIIGNQRWTTIDYKGDVDDDRLPDSLKIRYGSSLTPDTTRYYSYKQAMTLNDSPTLLNYNAPSGLVETSDWRIPSWSDENELYFNASGNEEAIATALQYVATGMVYHEYDSYYIPDANIVPVWYNPTKTVYWNSDFTESNGQNDGTWFLTGSNTVDYIYLFQFQLMMPYAPIRLVQNIEPLE